MFLRVLGAAARQQPVFRGAGDAVRVFVTVTDGDGRLVTTLTQDDFEVRDEGKPQPITLFDNTPQPIRLIVMLDVSGSMEGNLPLLRAAAEQLFARLRPDDVARVGTFGHDIAISPSFTRDPDELRAALPTIDRARCAHAALARDRRGDGRVRTRTDEARRVILVLSDGKDSGPIGFRQRFVSQAEVIDRARDEDVMIYAIGMRSRSSQPMPPGIGPGGLQAMLMADLPDPGLARVARGDRRRLHWRFASGRTSAPRSRKWPTSCTANTSLGFAPPKRDGKVHDIDVRVTQRGLKPRARKSYVAPKGKSRGSSLVPLVRGCW